MHISKIKMILNGTESSQLAADKIRLTELGEQHAYLMDEYCDTIADKQRYVYALAMKDCKSKEEFLHAYNLLLDIFMIPRGVVKNG